MVSHDGNGWVFSSGRRRYAHTERLSIDFGDDGKPTISYGSDGGFWLAYEVEAEIVDANEALSKDDLRELAEMQIQRWMRFIDWLSTTDQSNAAQTDEKGRPMTYWGGKADKASGSPSHER